MAHSDSHWSCRKEIFAAKQNGAVLLSQNEEKGSLENEKKHEHSLLLLYNAHILSPSSAQTKAKGSYPAGFAIK